MSTNESSHDRFPRRELLTAGAFSAASISLATTTRADQGPAEKPIRIGVVSASIGGKPHKTNGHTWCPDVAKTYCSTSVHFAQKTYEYTPAIEGDYWFGHHYQIVRMAHTFLEMIRTRIEPVPHKEILEVTAIIHAGAKSLEEKSRLVSLSEVMA